MPGIAAFRASPITLGDLDRKKGGPAIEGYTVFARRCTERSLSSAAISPILSEKLENLELIRAYPLIPRYHHRIIQLMESTDGSLNYHDALISLSMKIQKLRRIATFDRGFQIIRWLKILQ